MRLLLVEDDEELSGLLVKAFREAGYDMDVVTGAREASLVLATRFYAGLVLDLSLLDENGLSVLRDLRRSKSALPVLILSGRDGIGDRVEALRAGADDYVVKPFATEELIARLEVLLRRVGEGPVRSLKLANLELLLDSSSQMFIDGQPRFLPPRDFAILEILLARRGRVVTKEALVDHISRGGANVSRNAIEVYVHRVRKLLENRGAKISIHTVKGVGYMIDECT